MIANRDIPFDVNVLRLCRCQNCQGMILGHNAGTFQCRHYIGGTYVEFPGGRIMTDPPLDAWHYCLEYRGLTLSSDVIVMAKQPPQQSREQAADLAASQTSPRIEEVKERTGMISASEMSLPGGKDAGLWPACTMESYQ